MSILTTKHLGKIYEGKVPYTALSDINFSIEKGEFDQPGTATVDL